MEQERPPRSSVLVLLLSPTLGEFGDLGKVVSTRGQTLNSTHFLVARLVHTALIAMAGRSMGCHVLELLVHGRVAEPSARPSASPQGCWHPVELVLIMLAGMRAW